jgi:membrane protein implicated in regulation of membrane protease activity
MAQMLLVSFFGILYLAVTVLFWRNVTLIQPWKAIFCLSIFPLFAAALVVNIALTAAYMPWLIDALARAQATGSGKSESMLAFVASSPIALLVSYLWYLVLRKTSQLSHHSQKAE